MTNQPLTESEAWALIDQVRAGKTLQRRGIHGPFQDVVGFSGVLHYVCMALLNKEFAVRIKPEPLVRYVNTTINSAGIECICGHYSHHDEAVSCAEAKGKEYFYRIAVKLAEPQGDES